MLDPIHEEQLSRSFHISRRRFVQMTSATGLAAALTRWSPRALAQAPRGTTPIAPAFPALVGQTNPGLNIAVNPNDSTDSSQMAEFLRYDPLSDPSAKYFRSLVPLAKRIPGFAPLQAQPKLNPRAGIANFSEYYMPLSSDDDRFDGTKVYQVNLHASQSAEFQYLRYGASNDVHATRFLNYHDILCSWTPAYENVVLVPNAAYVDAAHRNGAIVLGIVQQPYFNSNDLSDPHNFLTKAIDGSFPVGDKLVDLAAYFGFDGYLIDIEPSSYPGYFSGYGNFSGQGKTMVNMFKLMHQRAKNKGLAIFHCQLYDQLSSSGDNSYAGEIDSTNAAWFSSGAMNSLFTYNMYSYGQASESSIECEALRLDPFSTVFAAYEMEGNNFPGNGPAFVYQDPGDPRLLFDPNAGSVANLFAHNGEGSNPTLVSAAFFNPLQPLVHIVQNQKKGNSNFEALSAAVYEADRQFWSGGGGNPAFSANVETLVGATYGVANYFAERSVIGSIPFLSRFNTGSGDKFFIEGAVSSPNPWFNIGVQDILPSWQWWTKDFYNNSVPHGLLSVDYDMTTAWDGGSSLKVSGHLGPNNPTEVRLFKTKIELPLDYVGRSIYLTYKSAQTGPTNLYIGLVFEDNPAQTIWLSVDDSKYNVPRNKTDWSQVFFTLFGYRGRTIGGISLGFKVGSSVTAPSAYALNIGEISVLDSTAYGLQDSGPSNLILENYQVRTDGNSAEVRLNWSYDSTVWYYDIYRRNKPNALNIKNMTWLGRISGDCYYVNHLPRLNFEKSTVLQLYPIALDGTNKPTASSTVKLNWI